MQIIVRPQTDPYFNIAAEEYFLKSKSMDCFMLWRNDPSIIVGKHQNTMAEINYQWVRENQIPVIRRISGGGTVFHDPGNLNFSFISSGNREKLVDFKKFMQPIIDLLIALGLPAKYEGKNDIRIRGLKVSGNAEHVYRNRVLHHGTLLFNAQLNRLNEAIKVNENNFADKAVKSIRSTVANIHDLLENKISIEHFHDTIIQYIKKRYPQATFYQLSKNDEAAIQQLADEKYKSWEWNFGYSPDYEFCNKVELDNINWEINLGIGEGLIRTLILKKNEKIHPLNDDLESLFVGKKHNFAEVNTLLHQHQNIIDADSSRIITKLLF